MATKTIYNKRQTLIAIISPLTFVDARKTTRDTKQKRVILCLNEGITKFLGGKN